jgi:hypothetical protein
VTRIIPCIFVCVLLLFLNIWFYGIHSYWCVELLIHFHCCIIFHSMNIPKSIYSVLGTLGLLWTILLWMLLYTYPWAHVAQFLQGVKLGLKLQCISLAFPGSIKWFFKIHILLPVYVRFSITLYPRWRLILLDRNFCRFGEYVLIPASGFNLHFSDCWSGRTPFHTLYWAFEFSHL